MWLASGWPVGGLLAGLAVIGVPWLLAQFSTGNAAVERLEALQEWVRRTSDVLAAGGGLEQTLIRSARTAPEPIAAEVATLAARLQARWPTSRALLAFADDLDDAAGRSGRRGAVARCGAARARAGAGADRAGA